MTTIAPAMILIFEGARRAGKRYARGGGPQASS